MIEDLIYLKGVRYVRVISSCTRHGSYTQTRCCSSRTFRSFRRCDLRSPPSTNCIVHVCTAAKTGPLMPKLHVRWEVNILVEVLKKCMLMSGRQSVGRKAKAEPEQEVRSMLIINSRNLHAACRYWVGFPSLR